MGRIRQDVNNAKEKAATFWMTERKYGGRFTRREREVDHNSVNMYLHSAELSFSAEIVHQKCIQCQQERNVSND